eukprot:32621-Karenia_brevis.AAC.1
MRNAKASAAVNPILYLGAQSLKKKRFPRSRRRTNEPKVVAKAMLMESEIGGGARSLGKMPHPP